MPVVGIPLDELYRGLGETLEAAALEDELHRFGCSVEGWATLLRYRCPHCSALIEAPEHEPVPVSCDQCGAALRGESAEPAPEGRVEVLRMELLAVRPDLFDPPGLARGLRGFRGRETGAPDYPVRKGAYSVTVDPALDGPEVRRPRISVAVVRNVTLDDARLRSLMKLQENVHWALGRDRKHASIGVYDLSQVRGEALEYRAAGLEELRFVPLGYDPAVASSALTPREVLEQHPKGVAFARLLAGARKVPLFADGEGGVLSMPPIINSEQTRVTHQSRDLLIDVTGLEDRKIDRALNIVVTSLLETCPEAWAETVEVRYAGGVRLTPALEPQAMTIDAGDTARVLGLDATPGDVAELLRRMRHDATVDGDRIHVSVPAWRADVMHARDLAEDVAIAFGYDRFPEAHLTSATYGDPDPREALAKRMRQVMVGLGATEVMTLGLTSEAATYERCGLPDEERHVRLEKPISVDQTMVRVSLIPGLMETLAVNLGHPYPQTLFEVGAVVLSDPKAITGTEERLHVAFAAAGDGIGYADARSLVDAVLGECGLSARDDAEFVSNAERLFLPGRGATLRVGGTDVGRLGEVHPEVLDRHRIVHPVIVAELDLDAARAASG